MNDQDRLWAALKRLSDAAPVELAPLIDEVSAVAEAARAAERERIATWLRAGGAADGRVLGLADAIERGEHGESS